MSQISGDSLVFSCGLLDTGNGKTAHGLIRGSDRFTVKALVDEKFSGQDAGVILDGRHRNIPIYSTVDEALHHHATIKNAIVGLAPVGGKLPGDLIQDLLISAQRGLNIISGLHDYVSDQKEIADAAVLSGATIIDIRKPKHKSDLHFWTGKIFEVTCPIVAVLGMDCAIGKRSTTRFLLEACAKAGIKAEMIFTGQTGWMQSGRYGFVFDSTYNDFVSGELEHAIHSCWKNEQPDIIFIEGQSGLRNPSGPCGSEMLVSGNAKKVILLAAPKRIFYEDDESWGKMPSIQSELDLIKMYGSEVIGVALNTGGCTREEALQYKVDIGKALGITVVLPLEEGMDEIIPVLCKILN